MTIGKSVRPYVWVCVTIGTSGRRAGCARKRVRNLIWSRVWSRIWSRVWSNIWGRVWEGAKQ